MEEKSKQLSDREKATRKIHIYGIILTLFLIGALWFSVGFMAKSVVQTFLEAIGGNEIIDSVTMGLEATAFDDLSDDVMTAKKFISVITAIATIVGGIVTLGGSIVFLILVKNQAKKIAAIEEPMNNPIKVSKAKYVWLGFLLGTFGGHFFAIKKKKAWVFLGLGVLGFWIAPAMIYTTGISFADAFVGCYLWKDHNGCIEVEDYPYWI